MNGEDIVNGFIVEQVPKTGTGPVVNGTSFIGDNDLSVSSCQPAADDCVYDLHIHNQMMLWKALPKPSNTSQVCTLRCLLQGGYVFALVSLAVR